MGPNEKPIVIELTQTVQAMFMLDGLAIAWKKWENDKVMKPIIRGLMVQILQKIEPYHELQKPPFKTYCEIISYY